jgi:lipopolysaccharide export system protein LptC|tara:strand:- start:7548 stop:8180 length:633 start_codon:yes stop_codon:yes gene_type:complete
MHKYFKLYSKIIKYAKYIFPIIAIGLFISIFAFGKKDAIRSGAIITDAEMIYRSTGQKITNPQFSGFTDFGDAFTLEAIEALPDGSQPKRIDLISPNFEFNTTRGIGFKVNSINGSINFFEQSAQLEGKVQFNMSNGYEAFSEKVRLDLKNGHAASPGPVSAKGPLGSITAGSMVLTKTNNSTLSKPTGSLKFTAGIRLIYLPSSPKPAK